MFLWLLCLARPPLRDRRLIRSFADQDTKSIFEQNVVERYRSIDRVALRRLAQIDSAEDLRDLAAPAANRLEMDDSGEYGLAIDDRHRICFRWRDGDAFDVGIAAIHQV